MWLWENWNNVSITKLVSVRWTLFRNTTRVCLEGSFSYFPPSLHICVFICVYLSLDSHKLYPLFHCSATRADEVPLHRDQDRG